MKDIVNSLRERDLRHEPSYRLLTQLGPVAVEYPSGKRFATTARVGIAEIFVNEITAVLSRGDDEPIVVLDPRAHITSYSGELIYAPRLHMDQLAPWVREWLLEHPEWMWR